MSRSRNCLSPFHAVGVFNTYGSGVVVEKGSEYILDHTGPREWTGTPWRVWVRV